MRCQLISDVHLEYLRYDFDVLGGAAPDVDLLVLAGDIMPWRDSYLLVDLLQYVGNRWPHVLMVPGNHEYYSTSPQKAIETMRKAEIVAGTSNVQVVKEPSIIQFAGFSQRFLAGTGWYSQKSVERIPGDPENGIFRDRTGLKRFSDFHHIRDLVPWVYQQNADLSRLLRKELKEGDVVVTHHLPSKKSIPKKFKHEVENAFFVNDLSGLLRSRKPKLWLHGHTHTSLDYVLGSTRVVCNPRGYSFERKELGPYAPVVLDV